MSVKDIYLLLIIITGLLISLFLFVIYTKISQIRHAKAIAVYQQWIEPIVNDLFSETHESFDKKLDIFARNVSVKLKSRTFIEVLENILLDYIENDTQLSEKAIKTVYRIKLEEICLHQIKSRRFENIAAGCHKAGLYKYREAIPHMLNALTIFSSETQMEILMALSRMGDEEAIKKAFDKIQNLILINERSLSEIMLTFKGNKYDLFKNMINNKSSYISALFLKAIDRETAILLSDEIINCWHSDNKEVRISTMKAFGKIDNSICTSYLIKALEDKDWEVRAIAAKELGYVTEKTDAQPLIKAIGDSEWWVRQNAANTILSYPDHENLLKSVVKSGDKYACDSIMHVLESLNKVDIIQNIGLS